MEYLEFELPIKELEEQIKNPTKKMREQGKI